jgi:precorrin-2 dehydrogenase / sirohydrochlorin ferrochelatase
MKNYPIHLNVSGKKAVVIGGGKIAARKIMRLLEAGAKIVVISPELTNSLMDYEAKGEIEWRNKHFSPADIEDAFLIIAATNHPEINLAVKKTAQPHQLINLVSHPEESNFILPSVMQQGKLIITVSTSGASPILARKIKQEISQTYGLDYKEYVDFLFTCRKRILEEVTDAEIKHRLLTEITEPSFLHSKKREADFIKLMNNYLNK